MLLAKTVRLHCFLLIEETSSVADQIGIKYLFGLKANTVAASDYQQTGFV